MCGIAGFSLNPAESIDAVALAKALLIGIEVRGPHATGVGYVDADGVWYDKSPTKASVYVKRLPMHPLATSAVLHTRYATKGSPSNNANNHPIIRPGIVGVHNGIVDNDNALFALLDVERYAEVDSEVIFAAINESGLAAGAALELIEGDAAVAWINVDDPNALHVARHSGRPLAVGQTKAGSFIFASTMAILDRACWVADVRLVWRENVAEGVHYTIRAGRIVECETFKVPQPAWMKRTAPATRQASNRSTKANAWTGGKASTKRQNERTSTKRPSKRRIDNFEQSTFDEWWAIERQARASRRGALLFDAMERRLDTEGDPSVAMFDDPDVHEWAPQSEAWEG